MIQVAKDKSSIYFNGRTSSGVGYGMSADISEISLLAILKLLYYKIASFVVKEK